MATDENLTGSDKVQRLHHILHARACGRMHDLVRKPSAGKRHARFDERLLETERWLGLRHWNFAKAASNSFPPLTLFQRASSRFYQKLNTKGLCNSQIK